MKTFFSNRLKSATFTNRPQLILPMALLVCALVLTGCLSRPTLNPQTFSFNSADFIATNAPADQPILGLKKLEIASPFDDRSFVYRTGELTYARDPFARFLDAPGAELLAPLRAGLAAQGDFSAVVGTGSALKPDILVEINVDQLYGDFRQPAAAKAVLSVHFTFFTAVNGIATQVIFQKEYARRLPVKPPAAAALMNGWNQALGEILTAALADFRQAKTPPIKP